jgi:predicted enzyme related to lactoylglutathione lyase
MRTRTFSALLAAALFVAGTASRAATPQIAVGPQYDTAHVYVPAQDFDRFVTSRLATFGGTATKQGVFTVNADTEPYHVAAGADAGRKGVGVRIQDVGSIPVRNGATGYLVTDLDGAVRAAKADGADVLVSPFNDPIGRDAVIQWPGGVNMQLYWHTTPPSYPALKTIPENRVYVSPERADVFTRSFLGFSHGKVLSDDPHAPGIEIGRASDTFRRIRITSQFGLLTVFVTDGHLPYPYGREMTGYEVVNLNETLKNAKGVAVLVEPYSSGDRQAAVVQFPGGYIAEIHSIERK